MALSQRKRAVGVFPSRQAAEDALHELRDSGFPMDRVSVVARDADKNDDIAGAEVRDKVGNKADEGAVTGAVAGGTLGGLTGLLVGLGALAIPGIGPIMLAGATATAIATTLSGVGIGAVAGSLIGALIGLGIPEERARVYNERVSRGEYLVIIDGNEDELRRAEAILNRGGIQEFGIYDAPDGDRVSPDYVGTPAAVVPSTGLGINKYAIGYFPHLRDAEQAIGDLRTAGFPLSQISLVAKKFERREPFAGIDLRDRFDAMRIGLPDERARFYNDRLTRGEYVVIVDGTDAEIQRAAAILSNRGIQEWQIYDPTTAGSTHPGAVAGTPIGRHRRAVGLFPNRRDAEAALTELRDSGLPMDRVSVIAKDADRDNELAGADVSSRVGPKAGNKAGQSAAAGAATGGALGGLGGLLVGLGTLAIPGVGPVIAGGAAATALSTAIAGGAIGAAAGGVTGGLVGLGIPDERARFYNDRVVRGDYLIIVDGTEDEIRRAAAILNRHGIQEWNIYDTPDVAVNAPSGYVAPVTTGDIVNRYDTPGVAAAPLGYVATTPQPPVPGTGLGRHRRAVGVFPYRREAEAALTELRDSGFPIDRVSVIAKDADRDEELAGADVSSRVGSNAGNKAGQSAAAGAATGGALGGLGGLLVGLGTLAIPGVGPVIAGGAAATALSTAIAGGAIGAAAGGVTGGLVGLGIPNERAKVYNDRVARGYYLVMVDGNEDEIRRAEGILNRHGIQDYEVFDAQGVDDARPGYDYVDPNVGRGVGVNDPGAQRLGNHPDVTIIDHRNQTP